MLSAESTGVSQCDGNETVIKSNGGKVIRMLTLLLAIMISNAQATETFKGVKKFYYPTSNLGAALDNAQKAYKEIGKLCKDKGFNAARFRNHKDAGNDFVTFEYECVFEIEVGD